MFCILLITSYENSRSAVRVAILFEACVRAIFFITLSAGEFA